MAINTLGRERLIPAGGVADHTLSLGGGGANVCLFNGGFSYIPASLQFIHVQYSDIMRFTVLHNRRGLSNTVT